MPVALTVILTVQKIQITFQNRPNFASTPEGLKQFSVYLIWELSEQVFKATGTVIIGME